MCVRLTQYPLVELEDGKKKILFNHGVVIENRYFNNRDLDSTSISNTDHLIKLWNEAIKHKMDNSFDSSYLYAVRKDNIKSILKYTCVPCGQCEECLKSKARGWAFRILKEAERFKNNYFITLTYDDEHLPVKPIYDFKTGEFIQYQSTLLKDAISKFNKSLKKKLHDLGLNSKFRFYGVGEYGSRTMRSHYHVIYFDLDIPDLQFYKASDNGDLYFTSELMNQVWKKGQVMIGALDIGSACYVARYCDKKLNRTNQEKLIISNFDIQPEFSVMSRRPGIGAYFIDNIKSNIEHQVYSVFANGNSFSIPLYYSKKIKDLLSPEVLKEYETRNENMMKVKFSRDMILSDILSTDLQDYYLKEDIFKKSCKKVRDNIKL